MRVDSFSILLLLSAYFVVVSVFLCFPYPSEALGGIRHGGRRGGSVAGPVPVSDGPTVGENERWPLESSKFGEISAVKISDGKNGCYYLHFITMNPRSLFLPAYLHSEMIFYVNSGRATLSWINVDEDDKLQQLTLQRGDVYRLGPKTVFYLQNNLDSYDYQTHTLEIFAIFPGSEVELHNDQLAGAYNGIHDLVLGFDNNVLQSTLGVPDLMIEELRGGEGQPLIVEAEPVANTSMWDGGSWGGVRALLGTKNSDINKEENKKKAYNIFSKERDVVTCYGWSVTVTRKELDVLKHTDFGVFMVNLNTGSMMVPHWNPNTAEVAIVLQGRGMIEVVCPSMASETGCENSRFIVEEGDVFVVPRYHPMAQISFNNDSFVFMGFTVKLKDDRSQYLTGKNSILQRIDKSVLAKSFNVNDMTIDLVLRATQKEKIIYECVSCAEEEARRESEEGGGWPQEEEERGRGRRGWQEGEGGHGRGGGQWPWGGGGGWQEEERGGGGGRWQDQGRGGRGGWQEVEGRGERARMEEQERREVEEAVA